MKTFIIITIIFVIDHIQNNQAVKCGCKTMRACYKDMIDTLQDKDEEACVEDASIGVSTVMIYLKALKQFCPEYIKIFDDCLTYEGRHLYEVELNIPRADEKKEEDKPVILIDAGQEAGVESVGLALFIIEQLIACDENSEMITNTKWIILPSTNPDGMEYARYNRIPWSKNLRPSEDGLSIGVNIGHNFDFQWGTCPTTDSGFADDFPGLNAASENETVFIKNSLMHHKNKLKLYLSLRSDGHGIVYPYAYTNKPVQNPAVIKIAGDVAAKVNQRAGLVQAFLNESIYEGNGKVCCGHSVDYAYNLGVPLSYSMGVFIGKDKHILSRFQQLPRGYEVSLRLGYFSGIRELYNQIADKKYQKTY